MLLELLSQYARAQQEPNWDWSAWHVAAQAEGLQGILANRCACAEARQSIKIQFAQQAIFHGELPRIDADLAREGLQAILLKGHALLPYYGGHLLLRGVRDLDLLVQRGQLQAARRALGLTGLQSRQVPNDYRIDVDLAEDLVGAERIRARARAYDFRQEQVWARSRPLGPQYRALRTLDPSYLFLHLAVHALKHGYSRLIWLLDLVLVLPRVDSLELLQAAQETRSGRPAAIAAELVHRVSGFDSPLRRRPSGLNCWERASLQPILERSFPAEAGELLSLFSIPGAWARLAFLLEFVFLRPEVVKRQYQRPLLQAYRARLGHILSLLTRSSIDFARHSRLQPKAHKPRIHSGQS